MCRDTKEKGEENIKQGKMTRRSRKRIYSGASNLEFCALGALLDG
jgi:hypothetical protein